jgi:hypothetical protein
MTAKGQQSSSDIARPITGVSAAGFSANLNRPPGSATKGDSLMQGMMLY